MWAPSEEHLGMVGNMHMSVVDDSSSYFLPPDLTLNSHPGLASSFDSQQQQVTSGDALAWHVRASSGSSSMTARQDANGPCHLPTGGFILQGDTIYMEVPTLVPQQQQQQQSGQQQQPTSQTFEMASSGSFSVLGRVQGTPAQQISQLGDTLYVTAAPESSAQLSQASVAELDAWGLPGWYSAPGVLIHSVDSPQTQALPHSSDLLLLQHLEPAPTSSQQQVEQLQAQLEQLQAQLQATQLQSRNEQAGLQLKAAALQELSSLQQLQRGDHVTLQAGGQVLPQRQFHHQAPQVVQQNQQVLMPVQTMSGMTGQLWLSTSNTPVQASSMGSNTPSSTVISDAWEQHSSSMQVQRLLKSISQNAEAGARQSFLQNRLRTEATQQTGHQINTLLSGPTQSAAMNISHSQLVSPMLSGPSSMPAGISLGSQAMNSPTAMAVAANAISSSGVSMTSNLKPQLNALLMNNTQTSTLVQPLPQRRSTGARGAQNNPRMMNSTVRAQPPLWAGADWNPRAAAQAVPASGTGVFLPQLPQKTANPGPTTLQPARSTLQGVVTPGSATGTGTSASNISMYSQTS